MAGRRFNRYSGIGGQAVLEGVMMKNGEKYAVAVRKPDGGIEIEIENYQGVLHGSKLKEIPFIRGIFNFIDSMILGMRVLNFSASFYDEESAKEKGQDAGGSGSEKLMSAIVSVISVVLAIGIFVVLPYYISSQFEQYIRNDSLMAIIEGGIRIAVFLLYVWGISLMKDIRRLYRYHGAEHKCINCIERGRPLTVRNAMYSSRLHKRCGTSFIFFVLIVSIILFFFIRTDNVFERVGLRILLMPVVAGISYELIRLAGRSNNIIVRILSVPGMLIQRLTTKEPDESMIEVAIASVEAVFDWKTYLSDTFGYDAERDEIREAVAHIETDEEEMMEAVAGDESWEEAVEPVIEDESEEEVVEPAAEDESREETAESIIEDEREEEASEPAVDADGEKGMSAEDEVDEDKDDDGVEAMPESAADDKSKEGSTESVPDNGDSGDDEESGLEEL